MSQHHGVAFCAQHHAKAQEALEQILKVNRQRQVDAEYLVQAYVGVGDYDQALTWLEWAASHQPNVLTSIKVEPIYDPFRSDPHFQNLLQRIGFGGMTPGDYKGDTLTFVIWVAP